MMKTRTTKSEAQLYLFRAIEWLQNSPVKAELPYVGAQGMDLLHRAIGELLANQDDKTLEDPMVEYRQRLPKRLGDLNPGTVVTRESWDAPAVVVKRQLLSTGLAGFVTVAFMRGSAYTQNKVEEAYHPETLVEVLNADFYHNEDFICRVW